MIDDDQMLLIPGIGFGDGIWTEFTDRRKMEYTMWAITLPGFGDTKPLPMPADEAKFATTPWIRSSLQAINALLDKEHIEKVTIVAHWALATQIALQQVWIRYLLEFYSMDHTARLKDLKFPVLVAQPSFDDREFYVEPGKNYMRNLCIDSWKGSADLSSRLELVTIPKSRLFIQYDQPEALDRAIAAFLGKAQK